MKKVLFVSSTGGHLNELLQLEPLFKKYKSYLVTEKTETTRSLKVKSIKNIYYLIHCTRHRPISYFFKAIINVFKSIYLFFKIRPDVIITTGAHTCVPLCYIGKLFRKKIIYIETFANIETKTLTGRLVYKIADLFIVQWENMLKLYPKAVYGGWIF